jgi:hypothetical protein
MSDTNRRMPIVSPEQGRLLNEAHETQRESAPRCPYKGGTHIGEGDGLPIYVYLPCVLRAGHKGPCHG